MKLYFVRHGKASKQAASDAQRPLTDSGNRQITRAAQVLKRLGVAPAYVFSSPRLRAKQTADILGAALGTETTVEEAVNFDFDIDKARDLLACASSDDAEILFVDHNPSRSEVVQGVTGASVSMTTGGIACVQARPASLEHSRLLWLLTPKLAAAFTDGD
jgi:phosphohistidine phosphatase